MFRNTTYFKIIDVHFIKSSWGYLILVEIIFEHKPDLVFEYVTKPTHVWRGICGDMYGSTWIILLWKKGIFATKTEFTEQKYS